jgi:Ca-activated chloride channel family protein
MGALAVGLTFVDPALLALALLLPVALWWTRRTPVPTLLFAPAPLLEIPLGASPGTQRLPGSWRTALLPLPRALQALGLLCAVIALARPVQSETHASTAEGIDLLLCLDVSSSMTAQDMDRSRTRLEVAREAAAAFVRARSSDRIGLVTFARYPDLRCPLTRDHEALLTLLAAVTTVAADGPEDATGIGAAVARAAQLLEGSRARSRAVVLLTDGEENVAVTGAQGEIAPAHAAQLCERLGVKVYAVAAGTGRPDPAGAWRKPDTRAVEDLAKRTGGAFHEARDARAMEAAYARIDTLEKAPAETPRVVLVERFLPFLVAALALFLGGRLLSATVLSVLP